MHDEMTIVSNLVKALDNARLVYVDASVHTTRPWLNRALKQLAQAHQLIANELCTYITTAGGGSIPLDGRRRTWRACWFGRVVRNHFDNDLAYVVRAKNHEDRLTRRFARAVRKIPEGDTHWRLERYLHEIDYARMKITRIASLVQEETDAQWLEEHASTRAPAAEASPQPAAQERSHFEA